MRSLGLSLLAAVIGAAAGGPAHGGQAPVTIRLATVSDPKVPASASLEYFKERVETESGGALRVEIIYSSKMYKEPEIGPAVSAGSIEMGLVNLSRYAASIPIADAFQQPFLFNTDEIENAALAENSEIRRLIDQAIYQQAGSRVLWWVPLGKTVLLSTAYDVAKPDKIHNKTIRSFGGTSVSLVQICGGIPKDVPASDQERAYGANEVDIGAAGVVTVVGRQLWRYKDTITLTNHSNLEYVTAINDAFWRRLSDSDRALISRVASSANKMAIEIKSDLEADGFDRLEKDHKVKIVRLTTDDLLLWRICSSDVLQEFVIKSGGAGQALMQAYGRMRARAGCRREAPCGAL